jgi:hypothetical protein
MTAADCGGAVTDARDVIYGIYARTGKINRAFSIT